MATVKVAITIEEALLSQVDTLVEQQVFPNRSKAFQAALQDKLLDMRRRRFAEACAKLNPQEEKEMAEEGMSAELDLWPEY